MMKLEPRIQRRLTRIAIGCVIGLGLAFVIVKIDMGKDQARMADMRDYALENPTPTIGQAPFTLTDQNNQPVTEAILRQNKLSLVSFGFTYCPDVCPSRIQDMVLGIDALGPVDGTKVQPVFITIDPARDNVAQMKKYIGLFGDNLIGLTGTAEQIATVAKTFQVYYAKSKTESDDDAGAHAGHEGHAVAGDSDDDYMMDHTTLIYLMGGDGRFITTIKEGIEPAALGALLKQNLPQ
jgi:cytochrome oxidase Cu insertion factor (SCO1/SenC/PrrC family)